MACCHSCNSSLLTDDLDLTAYLAHSARAAGWLPQQLQQLRSFSIVSGDDSHDDFKPKYKQEPVAADDVDSVIKQDIGSNKVFIYMKASASAPVYLSQTQQQQIEQWTPA
jgi:hypothetical protein